MHSPYRMGSDFSGWKMADCDRAMQCLRYVGAKDRELDNSRDRWVLVENTENCQDFIKILSPEERKAHLDKLSRFIQEEGFL